MRFARLAAAASVLAVMALHNDWWNRAPREAPVLGFVPADIAYHALWLAAASLVLWLVLRVTWPRERRGAG